MSEEKQDTTKEPVVKKNAREKIVYVSKVVDMPELIKKVTKFGSRKDLKLPKYVEIAKGNRLTPEEKEEIAKGVADAKGEEYEEKFEQKYDRVELHENLSLRYDGSELTVIMRAKRLSAYIMTVTAKSPVKFRFTFVNRLQNYSLDILENLVTANSIRRNSPKNKTERLTRQHKAYTTLQLLAYMALVAMENKCITRKQYEQIAVQTSDCINLLVAWTRSESV